MLNQFDRPLNLPLAFATAPLSPSGGSPSARAPITPTRQTLASGHSKSAPRSKASSGTEDEGWLCGWNVRFVTDPSKPVDTDSDSSFFMISSASPASSTASVNNSSHKYPPKSSSTLTPRESSRQILREENAKLQCQVTELSDRLARTEEVLRAQLEKEQAVRNSVMLLRREVRFSSF